MVVDAPRIEQVLPHFLDFARDAVVVGHNAAFDLGFLNYELARLRRQTFPASGARHRCAWRASSARSSAGLA